MEQKLMYLILAGWALMLFLPSIFPAFVLASALGGAATYMVFIEQGADADLIKLTVKLAPIATMAVFAAWPVGALFRWVLRRKHS